MDVAFVEQVGTDAELNRMRTHIRPRGGNGFFHHIAQLSRLNDASVSRHGHRFNRQDFTADFRPSQARRHTDQVLFFRNAERINGNARIFFQVLFGNGNRLFLVRCHQLFGRFARQSRQSAVKTADARFARVQPNQLTQSAVGNRPFVFFQSRGFALFFNQVAFGDFDLFVLGIARNTDDFHTIQQRTRHFQRIRRRDEHHVGQVVIDFQIMVAERAVLRGVKNLQQRRRRIAAPVRAQLVDFIQQEQRIAGFDFFHALDDFPRQSPDVSAAVTANLGFVAHAAQAGAHKLAPRRPRNGFAQRGFTHTRRSDQAQNRTFDSLCFLLHRQVFQNALFDLFQTVVVFVQNLFGGSQIRPDFRRFAPRQINQPIQVVADDRRFGRHGAHVAQFFQFGQRFCIGFRGHFRLFDFGFQFVVFGGTVIVAQLFLNGFHLFVQIIVALGFFHLLFDAAADFLFDLQNVLFGFHQAVQFFDARQNIRRFQQILPFRNLQRQMRRNHVRQL